MLRSLFGLTAVGAVACSAGAASIFLEYADPPGELSVMHTTAGPGDTFSTLSVNTTVDLEIDLTDFGMGTMLFADAMFTKSVNIGQVNEVAPGTFLADATDGMYEFLDSGGNLIASGTYGENGTSGGVFILDSSGALTANASVFGGELAWTVGAFLQGVLDSNNEVIDFSAGDASWTLTALAPGAGVTPEGYFTDFDANGSFSGTIVTIPAPASVAMLGLGGLAATRRRR